MPRPAEIEVEECAGAERVVFALGALGEAGEPAALAQRADAVAAAGEDLVRIGLMADVPDQPVARRVEHVVQRHRQFDDAEAGAEMAAGHRDRADRLGAQFVGELAQVACRQGAQIGRRVNAIEQRRLRLRHGYPLSGLGDLAAKATTTPEAAAAPTARARPAGPSIARLQAAA